jgi:hypothetical protein
MRRVYRDRRVPAAAVVAVLAGSLLLAPGAVADTAPDPGRCEALQRDVDAYRRGEVQYFVDPTPAWKAEAERYGCTVCGL